MLRLWNLFRQSWIDENKPICNICGESAIGHYYDEEWESVALCQECYVKMKN